MVIFYVLCMFLLAGDISLSAAASSSKKPLSRSNSARTISDENIAIKILSDSQGGDSHLSRSKQKTGPDLFSLNLQGGMTVDHYEGAKEQIVRQIEGVPSVTPRTDRTKRTILEQLTRELERQKLTLNNSSSSTSSEDHDQSVLSGSSENLTDTDKLNSMRIALELLTQLSVRQQDEREYAEETARAATFRANIEAAWAILGTLVGIVLGIIPLIIR